ncbi:DMT family transporter [Baaleninema simplex]|uniref:DMT family transporter n=1 Tax=Baaleninema simplex TaxID=2862350 RepID=UPI00034DC61E|nr:DMT family transporter [Baaleninema simplex]
MDNLFGRVSDVIRRVPGRAYLLLAVLIFAAANSVTRRLTELGAQNLIDGRNPISFCNVLFVGNLCALLVLSVVYKDRLNARSLAELSREIWLKLSVVAVLSGALAPALIFMAIERTSVNNVILVGRLEPPLALALSVLFLKERLNKWVVLGAIVSFAGVALTVVLQPPTDDAISMGNMMSIGRGEVMVAIAAVALAISTTISQANLARVSLGLFTLVRTAVGTAVFFAIVMVLFGWSHFMDIFSPILWRWMFVYGAVIVVGGQLCWFRGLKTTRASEVSLASSFSPVAGVLAAYFILGEVPTSAQYIGGSAIILGIALNQFGVWKQHQGEVRERLKKERDMEVGFKGI